MKSSSKLCKERESSTRIQLGIEPGTFFIGKYSQSNIVEIPITIFFSVVAPPTKSLGTRLVWLWMVMYCSYLCASAHTDLTDAATFRDLSKPVGALSEDRLLFFQVTWEEKGDCWTRILRVLL